MWHLRQNKIFCQLSNIFLISHYFPVQTLTEKVKSPYTFKSRGAFLQTLFAPLFFFLSNRQKENRVIKNNFPKWYLCVGLEGVYFLDHPFEHSRVLILKRSGQKQGRKTTKCQRRKPKRSENIPLIVKILKDVKFLLRS